MDWRVLISGKMDPFLNMGLDEAIYIGVGEESSLPTIRFYDWEPASFSCGYNQDIEKELDFNRLVKSDYGFVRRPTGGRMVLHEDEVTYAVIARLEGAMGGNILDTYMRISSALAAGLKKMDIDVELSRGELSRQEQKKSANPCFTSTSRFELSYKRKKLVGSAQTRNSRAFLQHGSILRTKDQKVVAEFVPGITDDDRLRLSALLERRTISLEKILGQELDFQKVVDSLLQGFSTAWPEDKFNLATAPSDLEMQRAKELAFKKYSTEEWNKKRMKREKRV
jgi:lipoate-protein ligase A